jgi:hypothetical protein
MSTTTNLPGTQIKSPLQNVGSQVPAGTLVGSSPGGSATGTTRPAQSIPIRSIQPVNIYKAPIKAGTGVTITNNTITATPGGSGINQLTGDVAAGPGTGSQAATLATVNSNIGTWNNITINGKGLATAGSNVAYLTGNQTITLTGYTTGSGATSIATTTVKVKGQSGAAAAGDVGEILSTIVLIAAEVSINSIANVATLALTAGNWSVTGELWVDTSTGSASLNAADAINLSVTTVSATQVSVPAVSGSHTRVLQNVLLASAPQAGVIPVGPALINSAGANVYLVATIVPSSGTVFGYGKLVAIRTS